MEKAEIAFKLQAQAQDVAEKTIAQLEDFISEDAKLERENAENTITILKERSRTFTNLSASRFDDSNPDQRVSCKYVVVCN